MDRSDICWLPGRQEMTKWEAEAEECRQRRSRSRRADLITQTLMSSGPNQQSNIIPLHCSLSLSLWPFVFLMDWLIHSWSWRQNWVCWSGALHHPPIILSAPFSEFSHNSRCSAPSSCTYLVKSSPVFPIFGVSPFFVAPSCDRMIYFLPCTQGAYSPSPYLCLSGLSRLALTSRLPSSTYSFSQ